MKPLFSLIVPIYKAENYLRQCVQSIIQQSFTDFELILVDDGSPDSCPQICDAFSRTDPRVKVIHKINEGVSLARKTALDTATGSYVVCVDSDDWIAPDCLAALAEIIRKYSVDIVCYGFYLDRGKAGYKPSKPLNRPGLYTRGEIEKEIFPSLIHNADGKYIVPCVWGKVFRTELLRTYILADPLATIGEDGASAIPCVFHADSIYITEECYYYYRYNEASATKTRKTFNWEWPEIVSKHISENIDTTCQDLKQQLDRKITHDVFSVALSRFNRDDSYRNIVKEIKKQLVRPYYRDAINDSRFKLFSKEWLARLALKYHQLWAVKCYSIYLRAGKR